MSPKVGAIILLVLLGGGLFSFSVPIVPISYQEPYEVEVPYTEQEEYTVQVPYEETVTVTKRQNLFVRDLEFSANTWQTEDFSLTKKCLVDGYWETSQNVLLFMVCSDATLRDIRNKLILAGLSAVAGIIFSGGTLSAVIIPLLTEAIIMIVQSAATSNDYYAFNSKQGNLVRTLEPDVYHVIIVNIGNEKHSKVNIGYNYETTETVTKYRTEIRYRTVTKYRTETRYRTKIIKITLWELLTGSYPS